MITNAVIIRKARREEPNGVNESCSEDEMNRLHHLATP